MVYLCMHDTIQTILTSEQKENVISLMSSFVFGSVSRFLIWSPNPNPLADLVPDLVPHGGPNLPADLVHPIFAIYTFIKC